MGEENKIKDMVQEILSSIDWQTELGDKREIVSKHLEVAVKVGKELGILSGYSAGLYQAHEMLCAILENRREDFHPELRALLEKWNSMMVIE